MSVPVIEETAERIRTMLPNVTVAETDDLPFKVEGSGDRLVQILYGGVWATTRNTTSDFPVVNVNVFADRSRDERGLPVRDDADRRAWALYEIVDALLHDTGRNWNSVISSYRNAGPALTMIPNGDGAVMLTVRYEIKV